MTTHILADPRESRRVERTSAARRKAARDITPRRRQVLYWLARGKTNDEIGRILGIVGVTVKNHVDVILRVYGCPNRMSAVMRALARGDVSFEEIQREFS